MGQRLQVVSLLGLAGLLALLQGILWAPYPGGLETDGAALSLPEALQMEGAIWVDARSPEAFTAGHYPGALPFNPGDWDEGLGALLERWNPGQTVIVYCDGAGCASSRELARRFREEVGMEPVYWLIDGWEALQRAGPDL